MWYLFFKCMHLIGMVAWFAGLFYLVRLFVYHREAFDKPNVERDILCKQYHIMEDRLFKIICQPALGIMWLFGLAMIFHNGLDWLKENYWLHIKLVLVFALSIYHEYNKKIITQLKNKELKFSSFQFRLYNEVPTIILVLVVLLAVYKNSLNFSYTFVGIVLFGILIFMITKWNKNRLAKKSNL